MFSYSVLLQSLFCCSVLLWSVFCCGQCSAAASALLQSVLLLQCSAAVSVQFCCSQRSAALMLCCSRCSAAVNVLQWKPCFKTALHVQQEWWSLVKGSSYGTPHEGTGFSTRGLNGGVVSCHGALSLTWAFIRGSIAQTCSGQFPAKH